MKCRSTSHCQYLASEIKDLIHQAEEKGSRCVPFAFVLLLFCLCINAGVLYRYSKQDLCDDVGRLESVGGLPSVYGALKTDNDAVSQHLSSHNIKE